VEAQEESRQYSERIQHYFAVNGVTNVERKRAIFLSVIGPRIYKLLNSLVVLSKHGEKMYDEFSLIPRPLPSFLSLAVL